MPGFVGICSNALSATKESAANAAQATVYGPNRFVQAIHTDHNLILQKSYVDFLEFPNMTAYDRDVHVWVDGEVYNLSALIVNQTDSFASLLLSHYKAGTLQDLLKRVDGIFIVIIYDLKNQQLQIITDRYGLKPFYLYARNNCLIVAPELKCFPYLRPFSMQIRKDVVDCFIQLEHMMGTSTWFDGVEVTEPSAIYTYVWRENTFTKTRYWSWSLIKQSTLSIEDAAEELAFHLNRAIKSRKYGDYKVGVALSGGFDSRAILAAVHQDHPVTYTFGIKESQDVRIAKIVAAAAGVQNIHYDLRISNWLERRFIGIWKTDGMLNMCHMHYSHLMNDIAKIMDVNLSGYLGDAVIGGTYLEKKRKSFLNMRISESQARHYYGGHFHFSDPRDSFFDIDKVDPYLLFNRGRRLIGLGAEEAEKTIHQRLPFMDINLMDFSYSLPDEFRVNSKVYDMALLKQYPEFYKNIPSSNTRVPIRINPSVFYKSKKLYFRLLWVVKYKLGMTVSYSDVHNWIKVPETANLIREILNPRKALYSNFTSVNFLEKYVEPHLTGRHNNMKQVMGALTMEIWLQQIMNKKYLESNE